MKTAAWGFHPIDALHSLKLRLTTQAVCYVLAALKAILSNTVHIRVKPTNPWRSR